MAKFWKAVILSDDGHLRRNYEHGIPVMDSQGLGGRAVYGSKCKARKRVKYFNTLWPNRVYAIVEQKT